MRKGYRTVIRVVLGSMLEKSFFVPPCFRWLIDVRQRRSGDDVRERRDQDLLADVSWSTARLTTSMVELLWRLRRWKAGCRPLEIDAGRHQRLVGGAILSLGTCKCAGTHPRL